MRGHVTAEEVIARMRPDPLLAVEEFAVAVLPRTAGFDVECPGSPAGQPMTHDPGGHFRAVIGVDVFGRGG